MFPWVKKPSLLPAVDSQLLVGAVAGAAVALLAARVLWPAAAAAPGVQFSTSNSTFSASSPSSAHGGAAAAPGGAAEQPAPSSQPGPAGGPAALPARPAHHANVNGVPLEEGRTMHLGVREGDVAARVLSVGDVGRAERLSALLTGRRTVTSSRGFVTHTGTFGGIPVTIVATLMGFANMDFVVRELHACMPGPMAVLRLGTCGGLQEHVPVGTLVLVRACLCVRRNPDAAAAPAPYTQATAQALAHHGGEGAGSGPSLAATPAFPYDISGRVAPHAGLSALYGERLRRALHVVEGLGASADSFYSSQGRASGAWGDRNTAVMPTLEKAGVCALEMETFHLLDLARASTNGLENRVYAAAASIVLFHRPSGKSLEGDKLRSIELDAGRAALEALGAFLFPA